jgi:intracellular sulfur oxidation DsrE/DsrF family protein
MRSLKRIAILAVIGLISWGSPALAAEYSKQKVVYHVNFDNPRQQTGALRNVQNHINAVGAENLDLRVVMHGQGVSMVLLPEALPAVPKFRNANADEQMQARIDGLKNQGVRFNICANTLNGRNVNREEQLYNVDADDIVPSGVAELAHLQSRGFTYIKP